jgi:hypothetical protein
MWRVLSFKTIISQNLKDTPLSLSVHPQLSVIPRDRMLLIMSWLKGENEKIIIAVSSDVSLEIADSPNTFISPVSYKDPEGRHIMASITGFEEDTDKDTIDGEDKE